MNKWTFLSIATICFAVVTVIDTLYPNYEECDCSDSKE